MKLRTFLDVIKADYLDKDKDFTIILSETDLCGNEVAKFNSDDNGVELYMKGNCFIKTLTIDYNNATAHVVIVLDKE